MRKAVLLLAATAVAITPAALPAQAGRHLDPREVAEARRQHAELVQEFGGAETGARGAYVQSVGRRLAAYSGVVNPGAAFHYTTLNSAVENAMAVPGGYIYITRQLLTLMDDESQLAFALGHETGHIAANHHRARQSAARRNSMGGIFGALLGSLLGGGIGSAIAQMSQQQAQLSTLSFSRDQEYQADTLATRYLLAAGYDPAGGPGVLAALGRASAIQARAQGRTNRQTPEWASTHPLSENRLQRAVAAARATGRLGQGMRNRDQFLAQLEGVYVDDDPAQGIIEGRSFTHPDLRIQFAVPMGYLMQNGTREVTIKGSGGQAQFSGGRYRGSIENYVYQVFQQLTGGRQQMMIPPPQRTMINGFPAAFTTARANTSSGVVDVSVMAYQWDPSTIYHFIMLTRGGAGIGPFVQMVESLRRISPAEAASIRPRVIDVVTVRLGDTVHSLAGRMAYRDFQLDRFLALNGLTTASPLIPGNKVKLVVYGARRS
ncbi:M48 family metalloprotease [Sphingomonas sp.]|uniref:M48 family metalloprotease n=1 Tax=Sphingomonas sp. TaxID=28214 RepID=UPI00180FACF1|nr:M48 family metalloprotease [Sphingomonas sp.]MBA3512440.1 M48 family metalloprotease [Sphingomonas sp.]